MAKDILGNEIAFDPNGPRVRVAFMETMDRDYHRLATGFISAVRFDLVDVVLADGTVETYFAEEVAVTAT